MPIMDNVDPVARQAMSDAFTKIGAQSPFAPLSSGAQDTLFAQQPQNVPNAPVTMRFGDSQSSANIGNTALQVSTNLQQEVDRQLSGVLNETDPMKIAAALSSVDGSIAATKARFFKEAQVSAYTEFGVADLERQFQQNKQMDLATPAYVAKYGNTDSDETAAVRARLSAAKSAADGAINEKMSGNVTLNEMLSKAATTRQIIARQAEAGLSRSERKDEIAQEFVLGLGNEGQKNMSILFPEESKDPRMLRGFIEGRNNKDKNFIYEAIKAPVEDIPKIAFAGNPYAQKIILSKEGGELAGQGKDLLKAGFDIAANGKIALGAIKDMENAGAFSAEEKKGLPQIKAFLGPALLEANDEHKAQATRERAAIAARYVKWKGTQIFNSDTSKINSDLPTPGFLLNAMADPTVNTTGKISMDQAKVLARNAPDIPTAQAQINELAKWYGSAAQKTSKNTIFAISPFEVEKLKTEAAMSRLQKFFSAVGDVVDPVISTVNDVNASGMANLFTPYEALVAPGSPSLEQANKNLKAKFLKKGGVLNNGAL